MEKRTASFFEVPLSRRVLRVYMCPNRRVKFRSQKSEFLFVVTPIVSHVPYDFCCREPFSYVHNNLFIDHNKQNKQLQYACCADFVHYLGLSFYSFHLCHNINYSTRGRATDNKCHLTSPHVCVSISVLV